MSDEFEMMTHEEPDQPTGPCDKCGYVGDEQDEFFIVTEPMPARILCDPRAKEEAGDPGITLGVVGIMDILGGPPA